MRQRVCYDIRWFRRPSQRGGVVVWSTHLGKPVEGTVSTGKFQEHPGGQWAGGK